METLSRTVVTYWVITAIMGDTLVYWTGHGWSRGNVLQDALTYRHKRSAQRTARKLAHSARHVSTPGIMALQAILDANERREVELARAVSMLAKDRSTP